MSNILMDLGILVGQPLLDDYSKPPLSLFSTFSINVFELTFYGCISFLIPVNQLFLTFETMTE